MMRGAAWTAALAAALAAGVPTAWAVNKCTLPDGRVVYQDTVCERSAAGVQRVNVQPNVSTPQVSRKQIAAAAAAASAAEPLPGAAVSLSGSPGMGVGSSTVTSGSDLKAAADACLERYRRDLRDPRSAYWSNAALRSGTVTMTLHATNGYGGFVTKEVSCDLRR